MSNSIKKRPILSITPERKAEIIAKLKGIPKLETKRERQDAYASLTKEERLIYMENEKRQEAWEETIQNEILIARVQYSDTDETEFMPMRWRLDLPINELLVREIGIEPAVVIARYKEYLESCGTESFKFKKEHILKVVPYLTPPEKIHTINKFLLSKELITVRKDSTHIHVTVLHDDNDDLSTAISFLR